MRIQPIVEGHGEVTAVPVLLRRLRDEAGAYGFEINQAIRRHRSDFLTEESMRTAVRLALVQDQCRAILILFDGDDDCPGTLAPTVEAWAQDEAGPVPCAVVIAHREYEAWFIAAIESLRGRRGILDDAVSHPDPETPRDAKGNLEDRMRPGLSYAETADQAALTALFDMSAAYARCRSFRRMVRAFELLVTGIGIELTAWPPAEWQEGA